MQGPDSFIQIGQAGEEQLVPDFRTDLKITEIVKLLLETDVWVSVDSFLQHLAHHLRKPGVVIWSFSDPRIFGYPYNMNLLKDSKYLRANQFDIWDSVPYCQEAFVEPEHVYTAIKMMAQREKEWRR